jgi:hypothetical protein
MTRTTHLLATVLLLDCSHASASPERRWDFEGDRTAQPPSGFTCARTGAGRPGRWLVQEAKDAPSGRRVLAQTDADATNYRFPLCVLSGLTARDLRVSVRFLPMAGNEDQAGGLVWRYRDPENYYVARANALENNVVAYKVVGGKRSDIDLKGQRETYGAQASVPGGRWSTLSVTTRGPLFEVALNGTSLFEVEDTTFSGGGSVGVWTKADSVTLFDDLTVEVLDPAGSRGSAASLDTARIEELTGATGTFDATEEVFKVSVPRSDLAVTVAGVRMTPPLGLTSWAAFTRAGDHAMVMGDLVLLEDQVGPVMSVALDNGLHVTALHNHFSWDTPKAMFMHIGGTDDQAALAGAVGKVFAKITETSGGKGHLPRADIDPARTSLDPRKIEAALGVKGQLAGGVYKLTVGRTVSMHGFRVGNAMGVNTWAAFAGADEQAIVDGDFAVLEGELQAVLKALRDGGVQVVAIHQHMTHEEPRLIFLHYWGVGATTDLARTLRTALDKTRHE